jgi:uncharacterized protein YajQ (UPF0234 family)
MPSFDIVSTVDMQEVKNAVNQVQREITTRYDFRGSKAEIALEENLIKVLADDQMKLSAIQDLVGQKLGKRGVSLKLIEFKEAQKAGGDMLKQEILVKQGLEDKELKKINKEVKGMKAKVTCQIQGDQLRVTGKKRDDLQGVISHLENSIEDMDLQFINFRD